MSLDAVLQQFVTPLKQFMSMAVDASVDIESVHVVTTERDDWADEVYGADILPGQQTRYSLHRVLLTYQEVGLAGVATWLTKASEYGTCASLALDAIRGEAYLESRVISAAASAEGLHRRAFEESRLIPRLEARALRRQLLRHTPDGHVDAVRSALQSLGEPSLRNRVTELLEAIRPALGSLVSDPSEFGKWLAAFRNAHAHLLVEDDAPRVNEEDAWLQQVVLLEITAHAVIVYLFSLCGVTAETLDAGIRRLPEYRTWESILRAYIPGLTPVDVEDPS